MSENAPTISMRIADYIIFSITYPYHFSMAFHSFSIKLLFTNVFCDIITPIMIARDISSLMLMIMVLITLYAFFHKIMCTEICNRCNPDDFGEIT